MNPNQPPPYPPHQPPHFPHGMPVPRDHDKATLTEIMPFGSRKIRMTRSPLTVFLLLCAVATPLLLTFLQGGLEGFGTNDRAVLRAFFLTSITATFLMTIAYCLITFFYAKPGRSIWPFLMAFVLLNALYILPQIAGFPFVWEAHMWLFRTAWGISGEALQAPNQNFLPLFGKMYVAAGLCEELFKALPILFGAALALAYQRKPGQRSGFVRFFQIRGPLDGALMGVFTGAAFVFFETGFTYVPQLASDVYDTTGNAAAGAGYGLMLLFPRVIGGIVGHSAYSAIFGYFIGLAVLRRRQAIPLILGGWLFASLLHGLWNSVDALAAWLFYVVAILSGIFAAAVILKARQLNQSLTGDGETMGSILVDRSGGAAAGHGHTAYGGYTPPPPYGGYPPAYGGGYPAPQPHPQGGFPPQPFQGHPSAPAPESYPPSFPTPSGGNYAPPPAQAPIEPPQPAPAPAWPSVQPNLQPRAQTETFAANAAPPSPAADGEQPLVLDIAGLIIPIRAGALIDLGAEPALGGRGAGARGEVVPHPIRPGVLGLRNSGERSWTAHLRDGRVQPIEHNQNIRMAAGVRIDFGDGLVGAVVAQG